MNEIHETNLIHSDSVLIALTNPWQSLEYDTPHEAISRLPRSGYHGRYEDRGDEGMKFVVAHSEIPSSFRLTSLV